MGKPTTIQRLHFGTFVRPAEETGTGAPRVEVSLGYLVRHEQGVIIFDTGIGAVDAGTEAHYRPSRVDLDTALADAGARLEEIDFVVNCHLHFDHCGGNPQLAGRPIFTQRAELERATAGDYTVSDLIDFPRVRYVELDGDHEMLPGVVIIPTTGHGAAHQSLVVETDEGVVVLAGQSHEHASDFTADALAVEARRAGVAEPLPTTPPWMERLLDLEPARVLFAQDTAIWYPVGEPSR